MTVLTLDQANRVATGAVAAARKMNVPPVTVVVLDASGHLVTMQREDGATMFRFDIARGKAWGAIGMGAASRVLAERARENPNFFVTLAATARGRFLPQPGAVLICTDSGQVLGAAGASGGTGDEDEAICIEGIRHAGLVPG
jgi:uncharacterized protein GlcG (DUF336 family)